MKKVTKLIFTLICVLLASCANNGKNSTENKPVVSELKYWDTSNYEKRKLFGKVVVFATNEMGSDSALSIFEYARGSTARSTSIGVINPNEYYEIALLKGEFNIIVRTNKNLFSDAVHRNQRINVVGGETIYLKVVGKDILVETNMPKTLTEKGKGTIYFSSDVERRIKTTIAISYNLTVPDELKPINVNVTGNVSDPIFKINGEVINFQSRSNNNYKILGRFIKGDNEISAEAVGLDGELVVKKLIAHIKTDKEIESELIAAKEAERRKIEEEKQRKINLEIAAKAKKIEEERIAREGDDSPDDLACKKYGLRPQTQGYAECRMRLDLARQDRQREQARNTQNQIAQENARKAELQRKYAEVERQNAERANRESQCRFVQSQEYLRPALGGFFESMNRANSAFDNCMAGVPQINTTCTKDGFGNINCTSR